MGNCFNKHGGNRGLETKSAKYQIQKGDENSLQLDDPMGGMDPEMQAIIKPMPTKPSKDKLKEDGLPYAMWKMNCMNQLKDELEAMFEVIERKVSSIEKRLKMECSRTDDDKLLKYSFLDYQDCLKLSRDRFDVLLSRD